MSGRTTVEASLRRLIAEGAYGPGDRLPSERSLSEQFGISRNVIREAISRLLEIGVLESRDRSGLYLARIRLREIFETRLLIEPACARDAAVHHTDVDALRLDAVRRQLLAASDPAVVAEVDAELHLAIVQSGGNAVLYRLMLGIADLIAFSRAMHIVGYLEDHDGAAEMSAIVDQILYRRGEAAEEAMRLHVEQCLASAAAQQAARELASTPCPAWANRWR